MRHDPDEVSQPHHSQAPALPLLLCSQVCPCFCFMERTLNLPTRPGQKQTKRNKRTSEMLRLGSSAFLCPLPLDPKSSSTETVLGSSMKYREARICQPSQHSLQHNDPVFFPPLLCPTEQVGLSLKGRLSQEVNWSVLLLPAPQTSSPGHFAGPEQFSAGPTLLSWPIKRMFNLQKFWEALAILQTIRICLQCSMLSFTIYWSILL